MALKFFPRQSTSLTSFLREYNLSLSYCTHPSLTRALGIFFSTPSYYVFAQQAGLYGDLYSVIVSEVSLADVWHESCFLWAAALLLRGDTYIPLNCNRKHLKKDAEYHQIGSSFAHKNNKNCFTKLHNICDNFPGSEDCWLNSAWQTYSVLQLSRRLIIHVYALALLGGIVLLIQIFWDVLDSSSRFTYFCVCASASNTTEYW